jgi:hypothetical protein
MEPIPDFAAAVLRFQAFLRQQNVSPDFIWIFREDVMTWRRRLYVKLPLPSENEKLAETRYHAGRSLGFGVCLKAFCLIDSIPCCHVWFAKDADNAAQHLCAGLKLAVPVALRAAHPVRSRFQWLMMKRVGAKRLELGFAPMLNAGRPPNGGKSRRCSLV